MHDLMHDSPSDALITISAAARRLGIDRSVLSRQIKDGLVRSHGQKVIFSEVLADRAANIDLTRSGRRAGRAAHQDQRPAPPRASDRASPGARPDEDNDGEEVDSQETVLVDGKLMTLGKARALKETYLALLRQQEFDVKAGTLVDRAAAEKAFFEEARVVRDGLLAWPARIAIEAAEEIQIDRSTGKVDPRSLTAVLDRHMKQQLTEMGEPDSPV
ncbi:hypothetical protein MPPM_1331 [Methylorubrum populi]|uniref:Helix-turn-helix domain-containing protein n=1 Tax=Methylorubrum populi TaxID=223967 RepID=A0A160PC30_9HYPH|nr:hypothetical protein [Methylorubrum populi]BAU89936.1 hypothetical protein MPPM_1331 [Methylorubrum populi]